MAFPLAGILLQIGSTILRGVGAKRGGIPAIVAGTVADAIDQTRTPAGVQGAIDALPPEQRIEILSLVNEAERIKADLEAKKIDAASKDFQSEQETHRAEANSTDDYTRRTRPHIARMSFYAATVYVASGIILPVAMPEVKQFDLDVSLYLALVAPALTYMGVRTFDKVGSIFTKRTK